MKASTTNPTDRESRLRCRRVGALLDVAAAELELAAFAEPDHAASIALGDGAAVVAALARQLAELRQSLGG